MNIYERALAVILILVLLGEINVIVQPSFVREANVTLLGITHENQKAEVSYTVMQGTYSEILKVALIPVREPLLDKNVYVYYDKDYPSSFISLGGWLGIIDHVEENLRLKKYDGKFEVVGATELSEIMLREHESILIIPSGVFPETVHTKEQSLVKQYLENGGILVWVGDIFAYHSGGFGGEILSSPHTPGLEAQERILGYILSNASTFNTADIETSFSDALSLKYSGTRVGIIMEEVLEHNGVVLGKTKEGRTSIAMVRVGNGSLVLFGGEVTPARTLLGEDSVASDIANILLSGVIRSNGLIAYQTINREDAYDLTLEIEFDNSLEGLMLVVVSDDYYSYFFQRQFISKAQFGT